MLIPQTFPEARGPNILVACHGNKWRSPLCSVVLRSILPPTPAFIVRSVGFRDDKARAAKPVRDYAESIGLNLEHHRSTQITQEHVDWADTIVYMDNGNYTRLDDFKTRLDQRVVCLGHFASPRRPRIEDPAFLGRNSPAFKATMELIVEASSTLAQRLMADLKVD